MRIFKYLIGIWTAIAVYSIFSFLSGPNSISSYNQLLLEREKQIANLNELEIINEELEKERNNLLFDYDTLMVHARQIGYAQEDERFIRIVGLENIKTAPIITGKVYLVREADYISDKKIKITALCSGLIVFSFFLMLDLVEFTTSRLNKTGNSREYGV
ncbi:MAG: septum formation initiator family protein [Treponema sp.]|nr:septum formation initiator family protein [Treponema sp.]